MPKLYTFAEGGENLHLALYNKDIEKFKELLADGANPYYQQTYNLGEEDKKIEFDVSDAVTERLHYCKNIGDEKIEAIYTKFREALVENKAKPQELLVTAGIGEIDEVKIGEDLAEYSAAMLAKEISYADEATLRELESTRDL